MEGGECLPQICSSERVPGAVSAFVSPHLDALQVRGECAERDITHFDRKSSSPRQRNLRKSNLAPESSFEGTAGAPLDVLQDERLEETVDLVPNVAGDVEIGSLIQ